MSLSVRCVRVDEKVGILIADESRGYAMVYTRTEGRGLQMIPMRFLVSTGKLI